jgi:hypothetical protein
MLGKFDKIINSTFYQEDFAVPNETNFDLIEKNVNAYKSSDLSLTVLNDFMELIIFLDQMYKDDPYQKVFFKNFKDPFIFALAKSYESRWLKFSHQTKEFFSLKVRLLNNV